MNDAHGNGQFHDDLAPAWDAVFATNPGIIAHVTGDEFRPDISLDVCVRAFHAAAVSTAATVHPMMLLSMFERYPDGAFGERVGSPIFADDVAAIWQQCIEEQHNEKLQAAKDAAERASYLTISDAPWDPHALPPRPWLAPPYLMRGEISLLHGPGGGGKSQLIVAWSIALVLGKSFGRLQPRQRCRVLLTNFEDDEAEQLRRISAALRFFGATPADLTGWLFRVSLGPKGDATMFELDEHGQVRPTPCWHALERACETIQPDAVALDPMVAINAVPEADNQLMRRVMTIQRIGLAQRFDCALIVAHHDTKSGGDGDDSDQTNARGGGDIVNAVRFELAVKKMSVGQAEEMSVAGDRRGFYFRVGSVGSKLNYTAAEPSEWFERLAIVINGEQVVRCLPWEPPTGKLTDETATALITAIGKGTSCGPYSPQMGNSTRSLGPLLVDLGIRGARAQRRALHELKDRHGVVQAAWRVPGRGDVTRQGLRTAGFRPENYQWCGDEAEPA